MIPSTNTELPHFKKSRNQEIKIIMVYSDSLQNGNNFGASTPFAFVTSFAPALHQRLCAIGFT
jgi:hypothetical protein